MADNISVRFSSTHLLPAAIGSMCAIFNQIKNIIKKNRRTWLDRLSWYGYSMTSIVRVCKAPNHKINNL